MRESFAKAVREKLGTTSRPFLVAVTKSVTTTTLTLVYWLCISGYITAAKIESVKTCKDSFDECELLMRCQNRHVDHPVKKLNEKPTRCTYRVSMRYKGTKDQLLSKKDMLVYLSLFLMISTTCWNSAIISGMPLTSLKFFFESSTIYSCSSTSRPVSEPADRVIVFTT